MVEATRETKQRAIDPSIFKAYDIRGRVPDQLNEPLLHLLGLAFTQSVNAGATIVVGYDGRLSSESFANACCQGIKQAGGKPLLIGQVSTGIFYHCVANLEESDGHGLMITGSHNPPEDNGIKPIKDFDPLMPEQIEQLQQLVLQLSAMLASTPTPSLTIESSQPDFSSTQITNPIDGLTHYQEWLWQTFDALLLGKYLEQSNQPNLVIDCGNGVAGPIAQTVFARYTSLTSLYCEVDGHFPHHHPDPAIKANLKDLVTSVVSTGTHPEKQKKQQKQTQWGFAFDGDGDRFAVVTPDGHILGADEIMMCFAQDLIDQQQSDAQCTFLFDVKTSQRVLNLITANGAEYNIIRTGHSFLKKELKASGADFAGELSGHMAFQQPGFDCGVYAGLKWLALLQRRGEAFIKHTLNAWPTWYNTDEITLPIEEGEKATVMEQLHHHPIIQEYQVDTTDGLRLMGDDHWLLVRPSNTTANLTVRAEGKTEHALHGALQALRQLLKDTLPQFKSGASNESSLDSLLPF